VDFGRGRLEKTEADIPLFQKNGIGQRHSDPGQGFWLAISGEGENTVTAGAGPSEYRGELAPDSSRPDARF